MLFDFMRKAAQPAPAEDFLLVRGRRIPLAIIRSNRARRYLLALRPDGSARLTIPRRGSVREGRQFAERNSAWLVRQIEKLEAHPIIPAQWRLGAEIMFRGEMVKLEDRPRWREQRPRLHPLRQRTRSRPPPRRPHRPPPGDHAPSLASRRPRISVPGFCLRRAAPAHRPACHRAKPKIPLGFLQPARVISLNWRLIQTPPFVRDYIILHELMHLRQMNHSAKYWREVESVCPDYKTAERWLKQNSALLK